MGLGWWGCGAVNQAVVKRSGRTVNTGAGTSGTGGRGAGNAAGAGPPREMGEPPGGGRESRRGYPAHGDGKGAPSLPPPCEL